MSKRAISEVDAAQDGALEINVEESNKKQCSNDGGSPTTTTTDEPDCASLPPTQPYDPVLEEPAGDSTTTTAAAQVPAQEDSLPVEVQADPVPEASTDAKTEPPPIEQQETSIDASNVQETDKMCQTEAPVGPDGAASTGADAQEGA
jgi:hypothetical protein